MTKSKSEKKSNKPGKKKSNSKGENKRMKKEAMINAIINVFKSSPKEPFNYRQISSMIGVTNQVQKLQVVDILYALSSDNFISEIDRGRYRYNNWGTTAIGPLCAVRMAKTLLFPKMGGRRFLWQSETPHMRLTVIR